jgi:UDPglucose 6-dehydrogenase
MNIAIAGTGYVGLVAGVCFAEKGNKVTCVDVDEQKIEELKNGHTSMYEPELPELMAKNISGGRLFFTSDYKLAYKNADVVFIGVGTPEMPDGSANLSYVFSVANQIAASVEQNCVVVVKSTVPIGTNDKVEEFIKAKLTHKVCIDVASNPEFLAQGTAVRDTLHAKRIIIGVENERAKAVMMSIYSNFDSPILVMKRRSAEMVKYASNDFLALKISYINEIANLCEIVGADIEDVTKGMSMDPRIGDKFLKPGCGYGGSCFPKDTKALHFLAGQNGFEMQTIKAAIDVNKRQKLILIEKAKSSFSTFKDIKIAVLGLTFKANTDDLREAPSIDNIYYLLQAGAVISVFDPIGEPNFKKRFPDWKIKYCSTPFEALEDACAAFIFTEWPEIVCLHANDFVSRMETPYVFDGRNVYDEKEMTMAGVHYFSIGR